MTALQSAAARRDSLISELKLAQLVVGAVGWWGGGVGAERGLGWGWPVGGSAELAPPTFHSSQDEQTRLAAS